MKIRLVAIATCVTAGTGAAILYGATQNETGANKAALELQLTETLKTRAETAKGAQEAMTVAYEGGTVTLFALLDANKALAEAEMALAMKPEEEIAALQNNVERMKSLESVVKQLYDTGKPRGEASAYRSVKRDRETAEITLLKARIQAKPRANP